MDIKQRLAELRAKKLAENNNAQTEKIEVKELSTSQEIESSQATNNNKGTGTEDVSGLQKQLSADSPATAVTVSESAKPQPTVQSNVTIGTSRTSEIDHLDFMSKMQELEEAIHTQHPKMPVLLMMIHKQLTKDPELVTLLKEEEIGVIVNGLKIQTKTELVGTLAKQSKSRDKKTKLDASMF